MYVRSSGAASDFEPAAQHARRRDVEDRGTRSGTTSLPSGRPAVPARIVTSRPWHRDR